MDPNMSSPFVAGDNNNDTTPALVGAAASTSSSNNHNTSSIAAFAARIQERALQLESERASLDVANAQLQSVQQTLEQTLETNTSLRRTYLNTIRSRHGMELELMGIKHQQEQHVQLRLQSIQQEIQTLQEQTKAMEASYETVARNVYAQHTVQLNLFQRYASGELANRQAQQQARLDRLNSLNQETELADKETQSMMQQTQQILLDLQALNDREEEEDEQIASLATQIKSALAKRASLRHALQDAKESYQKANENVVKWEQECIEFS